MNTKTSNWMRRLAAIMTSVMVFTSFVGQASARILFQDDTVGVWESDQLQIGSNDAGAVDTSLKFGADATEANNGLVNWDTATQTLQITAGDSTATKVAITGDLSATGQVNFSGATGTRLRESSSPSTLAACATLNELIVNTTDNKIYICTTTGIAGAAVWSSTTPSASDFEAVYAADADKTLTTGNGAFTIDAGTNSVSVKGGTAINLNDSINGAVNIGTGTSTGTVTLGGTGAQTIAVGDGAGAKTVSLGSSNTTSATTILSGSGAVNVNANNNQATNVGTGTSTGLVTIGGGSGTAAINTTSWDISSAGVASGFTGITSTGAMDFSGASAFRVREVAANPNTLPQACATVGELIVDTTTGLLYTCTDAGADTWVAVHDGGNATTLDTIDSTQFLRSDTSDNYTSGTLTFDSGTTQTLASGSTLNVNGVANIGDGGDAITVNSNTWDVSGAGAISGLTGIVSANGTISLNDNSAASTTSIGAGTTTGAITIGGTGTQTLDIGDGAGVKTVNLGSSNTTSTTNLLSGSGGLNLNVNNNQATNIGTGTTTGTVSIGGGADQVVMNSTTWDISGAGAASGFTTVDASGNFTTSGGSFCVGTTCLNETNAAGDNGATLVGVDTTTINNSASTTVQGVLEDFGNLVGSNAPNVEDLTFHPEYPDTVVFPDGSANAGTLSSAYDDTNNENYYHWQSNNGALQDMDLKFRFVLPADFAATGNLTFRYRTGSAVNTDNKVDMTIFNATDLTVGNPTSCGTSTANVNAAAWATGTITAGTINTGCTGATALNAGDLIEIDVKLYDNSGAADYSDVGYVSLAYTN